MMQVHRYSCGGYVAHKLRVNHLSTMRYSVWFSEDGKLMDAEGYDRLNRPRPVSARVRAELEKMFWHVAIVAGGN